MQCDLVSLSQELIEKGLLSLQESWGPLAGVLDEGLIPLPDLPGKHPWNPLGRRPRYLCRTFLPLSAGANTADDLTLQDTWVEFPEVTWGAWLCWGWGLEHRAGGSFSQWTRAHHQDVSGQRQRCWFLLPGGTRQLGRLSPTMRGSGQIGHSDKAP